MNFIYPATTKSYANGQIGVFFVDVPEAITAGATLGQALDHARDALVVALAGYLAQGRAVPPPSKTKRGQRLVAVPPRAAIKIAIHDAMRESAVTQAQLAQTMGIDARQVRRLLDLGHESRLSQLEAALAALGLHVEVSVSSLSPGASSAVA